MAKTPDHMAGINALPRWDRSNPTTYSYDPSNYDRNDYAAFKQARMQRELETNPYMQNLTAKQKQDYLDGKPVKLGDPFKELNKKLNREINQAIQEKVNEALGKGKHGGKIAKTKSEVRKAAAAGETLYANVDSTCFSELSWTDGVATGTFWGPKAGTWDWPCDLETFIEWTSGSLGEFFNDEIR